MTKPNTDQGADIARILGLDRSVGQSQGLKRRLGWAALALVMGASVLLWSLRETTDTMQFKTQAVRRGTLSVTVTATGNLEPTTQVDVGIEVSGTIASVEVDYNDQVKIGQVLAKLDTAKLEAQVLQSKAAVESAQARVLEAQATVQETRSELARLKQAHKLSGGKVPSQHDLDTAEAAFTRAQADTASTKAAVSEARASLKSHETDLAKALIYSPINGLVLTRNVDPGQTVAASFQTPKLFTLAEDLTQMELHVDVDEADVGQVRAGQHASFSVDAYPDRIFPAQVTQVRYGSQEVEGVISYETVLHVDNSDLSLRPGMTATADITVERIEHAILVPNAALRFSPPIQKEESTSGGFMSKLLPHRPPSHSRHHADMNATKEHQRVWVLRNGQPVAVPVTVGATDGIVTQVLDGAIEPDMALVVETLGEAR